MRKYLKASPRFWTDNNGARWKVPTPNGRLQFNKSPGYLALRSFVLNRDGHRCRHCGAVGVDPILWDGREPILVADHIVSNRNGGSNHPDNLQCLCDPCNARKGASFDKRAAR